MPAAVGHTAGQQYGQCLEVTLATDRYGFSLKVGARSAVVDESEGAELADAEFSRRRNAEADERR